MEAQKNGGILLEKVKKNDYFCKKNMKTDTISKGPVFYLADDHVEIATTVYKETGNATYRIAIVPDEMNKRLTNCAMLFQKFSRHSSSI